ncbi:MAG: glycosyltransferase family 1 protein [Myxococcota bacterium]|jgi:glycosyltransferase involved in cell wall biosynthesis|nr:glycosyltransferase family 1 protein [Myxococcota bacterium]
MLDRRRILIDGSMAAGGGGYTYLVNMLPTLATLAPEAKILVLVRNAKLVEALSPLPNIEVRVLPKSKWLGRIAFLLFKASRIANQWGADLYFSVGEYAPLKVSCPVVICLRNPNVFTSIKFDWSRYQKFRLATLRALATSAGKRAARVVFVSHDSASWMGDAAGIPGPRRAVIHHGADVDAWRAKLDSQPRGDSAGILSVSSIYRYKNFVRLVEAYCELASRLPDPPPLTIVGDDQDPEYSAELRRVRKRAGPLADRIHLVGAVPYEEITRYYAESALFVFPSYLETFGHPLLEALAAGVPVVAADIPVFREIAAESALYVDPFDSSAMATAMEQALTDRALADELVSAGQRRLELFTWQLAAQRLAALLSDVVDEY